MLIGYVSDEFDLAIPDVAVELERNGHSIAARSTATGAIEADLPREEIGEGTWRVTLAKSGFGSKWVDVLIDPASPSRFRLLHDGLLGYMWPKWVRSGEQAEWRVHSPEAYKVGLWRYGWRKEFIRNVGWYDEHGPRSVVQIVPDGDFTQTGVQWSKIGYNLVWHKQRLTAPERGGLYYLHAKSDTGRFFSFPWIVSPKQPTARIAVLACNLSWNAYNNFGGRSNYVNQNGIPPRPATNARQDLARYQSWGDWPFEVHGPPLSFDRPEPHNVVPEGDEIGDPIEGRLQCFMAPAEWRTLGWLEREGFSYDLYPETDIHFDKLDLSAYDVLILNTHHEYWSPKMYERVKRWVFEEGGKLVSLAGCCFYAEVDLPDETAMLCHREGVWEGRGESAGALLGVEYSHAGYQSGAPYRVIQPDHWAFAGTGLREGDCFGFRSLHERCPGGASGHELDSLSPSAPANTEHLARGTNGPDAGADLVSFETPSGGAVFATGSLCWPLSLFCDDGVSRITSNVLRKYLER